MASRSYYREKFEALETEKERRLFCLNYVMTEVKREGQQMDVLPDDYMSTTFKNMKLALEDVGRLDLWNNFERALLRFGQSVRRGIPDANKQLVRDILGELYQTEPNPPA